MKWNQKPCERCAELELELAVSQYLVRKYKNQMHGYQVLQLWGEAARDRANEMFAKADKPFVMPR